VGCLLATVKLVLLTGWRREEGSTGWPGCVMEAKGGGLIFSVVLRRSSEVEGLLLQDLLQEDPGATECGCH